MVHKVNVCFVSDGGIKFLGTTTGANFAFNLQEFVNLNSTICFVKRPFVSVVERNKPSELIKSISSENLWFAGSVPKISNLR